MGVSVAIDIGYTNIKVLFGGNGEKVIILTEEINDALAKQLEKKSVPKTDANEKTIMSEFVIIGCVPSPPLNNFEHPLIENREYVMEIKGDNNFENLIILILQKALNQIQIDLTKLSEINIYLTSAVIYKRFCSRIKNKNFLVSNGNHQIRVEKCEYIEFPSPLLFQICSEINGSKGDLDLPSLNIDFGDYTTQSIITTGSNFNWISKFEVNKGMKTHSTSYENLGSYKNLDVELIGILSEAHIDYIYSNNFDICKIRMCEELIREIKDYYKPLKINFGEIRLVGGCSLDYKLILEAFIKRDFPGARVRIAEDPLFTNCQGLIKLSKFKNSYN